MSCLCLLWGAAADAQTSSQQVPSLPSLFTDLGSDVAHIRNWTTVWTLAIGGGTALALRQKDDQLTRQLFEAHGAEEVLDPGQVLGGAAMQVGGAFATYAIGRSLGNVRVAVLGSQLFRAQVLNAGLTQGLKFAVGRERPDGGRYSFPSGHTSAAFATATILQSAFGWKVGIPAYVAAGYVGVSRLSENQHFASDVAFGAAIGIVTAHAVVLSQHEKRVTLTPYIGHGGRDLGLTLTFDWARTSR
ncbi:MAG TPA: phosphatase PAP2 family protein [Vicinamibacterales bacterium]|nr:phosphatase PAP2 family protein [Vicinamibacterales bacterium]